MANMKPPNVPSKPVGTVDVEYLRRILATCKKSGNCRGEAIILLYPTGGPPLGDRDAR